MTASQGVAARRRRCFNSVVAFSIKGAGNILEILPAAIAAGGRYTCASAREQCVSRRKRFAFALGAIPWGLYFFYSSTQVKWTFNKEKLINPGCGRRPRYQVL